MAGALGFALAEINSSSCIKFKSMIAGIMSSRKLVFGQNELRSPFMDKLDVFSLTAMFGIAISSGALTCLSA